MLVDHVGVYVRQAGSTTPLDSSYCRPFNVKLIRRLLSLMGRKVLRFIDDHGAASSNLAPPRA
jgi:hypothetical protein